MHLFGREIEGYKQWFVLLVTVLLVASGLCGLQWAIIAGSGGRGGVLVPVFMLTGVAELTLMALSAVGILLVLIIWPISILYNRHAQPPKDNVQRLFKNAVSGDEEKSKDRSDEEPHDR
jgi:hypothetical protein